LKKELKILETSTMNTLFSFLVFYFIFQVASLLGVSLFWQPAIRIYEIDYVLVYCNVDMCGFNKLLSLSLFTCTLATICRPRWAI